MGLYHQLEGGSSTGIEFMTKPNFTWFHALEGQG
jgi:hypothetical protein